MELQEALYKAFKEIPIHIPKNTKNICLDDVVLALTIDEYNLPELLGYSASGDGGFKHFRKRLLPNKPTLLKSYIRYILSLIGLQICTKCNNVKDVSQYYLDNTDLHYTKSSICKDCDSLRPRNKQKQKLASDNHYRNNKYKYIERNASRRVGVLNATPIWANKEKILEVYKTRKAGEHTDHIIPIKGKLVCGLHVENNLQNISAENNLTKSNKFSVTDYPNVV